MLTGPPIYDNETVFVFVIAIDTAIYVNFFRNETEIIFVGLVPITISSTKVKYSFVVPTKIAKINRTPSSFYC
jgi:hypothetical protein